MKKTDNFRTKYSRSSLLGKAAGCAAVFHALPALAAASGQNSATTGLERLFRFMSSVPGRGLLILCFFLLIVLVLRALYGPKGKLRDPKWDELNRQQKLEDETIIRQRARRIAFQDRLEKLAPLLERETQVFQDYVQDFLSGDAGRDAMFLLKQEHTLNVLEHAISIAAYEQAFALPESSGGKNVRPSTAEQPDRVMLLAALYHDLGRFEQLKRFNTFRDADSINHAKLGASLLRDRRFLAGESDKTRGQVRAAVLLHNRSALPAALRAAMIPICRAVRDADKLDIMRVMSLELSLGRSPDRAVVLDLDDEQAAFTAGVLRSVLDGRQVAYRQMRYVNDYRLLLCSWLSQLSFHTSRRVLARNGNLREIMQNLPDNPEINKLRDHLNAELDGYL